MDTDRRAEVWAKTGGRCWYCGMQTNPWTDFHVEHMIPRRQGGTDELANLVPSCRTCNLHKHSRTVEEFRLYLQAKAQHTFWFEHGGIPLALPTPAEEEDAWPQPDRDTYQGYLRACVDYGDVHPHLPLVMMSLLIDSVEWELSDHNDERVSGQFFLSKKAAALHMPAHELLTHLLYLEEEAWLFLWSGEHVPERTHYEFRIGALHYAMDQDAVRLYEEER